MFELTGTVHSVGETKQITDKFRKRELILFVENSNKPEYSDYIPFEVVQDGCQTLEPLSKGDRVKISFFVNGRLWKEGTADEKAFSSLSIKDVVVLENARNSGAAGYIPTSTPPPPAPPPGKKDFNEPDPDSGLPF
jgi:hypothetical protein